MWFFYAVALPLLVAAIVLALRIMPARGTHWTVHLDVGLAWFSALSTLVLVPTDVSTTIEGKHPEMLRIWWLTSYWYGFIVMFTLLPFHQEYADSGHFHIMDKCIQSLRNNLIFYAVLVVLGAGGIVILLLSGRLVPSNVVGFCLSMSNAFGLIAGIFVMGYGLVAIPRQLWRTANIRGQERLLQHRAGVQAEKAIAARSALNKARSAVQKVSQTFNRRDPLRKYMDKILQMASDHEADLGPITVEEDENLDLDYFDVQDLGKLRRRLRTGIEGFQRERELYLDLVRQYLEVQDVLTNMKHSAPFRSTLHGETTPLRANLEWYWRCALRGWTLRFLAVLAAALSLAVIIAESTISPQLPNLSVFSLLLQKVNGSQFLTSLLVFLSVSYPCMAAYYALFKLGRFGFYLLVPGHSNAYSLLTNALLMCRFAPPLAFNFMAALAMPASKHDQPHDVTDTVFYHEFGELMMRQPVIGFSFTTYAPLVLVPYVILLAFNMFNRMAAFFTRSAVYVFEDDWETRSPYHTSGERLLNIEVENFANGRPLGLTISPQGTGSDPESGQSGKRWWQIFGGGKSRSNNLLNNDFNNYNAPPVSAEVLDARSRLSRALGKEPQGNGNSQSESSESRPQSLAPTKPSSTVRGLLGLGRQETGEEVRLFQGESSTQGDLDSIFAKMGESNGRRQDATLPRRSSQSLNVESDSEETNVPSKWFRRKS